MLKWDAADLPQPLREFLAQTYNKFALSAKNFGANRILYVRELDDREKSLAAANMTVQTLYKFKGNVNAFRLNNAISRLNALNEVMRSNFFTIKDTGFAVVFNGRDRLPEIVFQNFLKLDSSEISESIHRLMEADKRRNFELTKGNLIRMTILHTKEDEYAILVTMSQLLGDAFNFEQLLNEAFKLELPVAARKTSLSDDYLNEKPQLEASIRDYWSKLLTKLPHSQRVPCYKPSVATPEKSDLQYVYRVVVPHNITRTMLERAQSKRSVLMTILNTAWGLMLREFNRADDAVFCVSVPSRDNPLNFNTVPIRLKGGKDLTIGQLVAAQFQQFLVSQPYSRLGWVTLEEISGNSKIFDHFLSFTDLMAEEKSFSDSDSEAPLEIISQQRWSAMDSRLGVHFNYDGNEISVVLKFLGEWLTPAEARLLSQRYLSVLQNMILSWKSTTAELIRELSQKFDLEAGTPVIEDADTKIKNAVEALEMFEGLDTVSLQTIERAARLEVRFDGDRVTETELEENLVFVAEGMLTRSLDLGDGWFTVLDIVVTGAPINELVLLETRRCKMSAEVLRDQTTLLFVPLSAMDEVFRRAPQLWRNVALCALSEMENYQSMWTQT